MSYGREIAEYKGQYSRVIDNDLLSEVMRGCRAWANDKSYPKDFRDNMDIKAAAIEEILVERGYAL